MYLRITFTMVEPTETRAKSKQGEAKKFAPKLKKKKNNGKCNAAKFAGHNVPEIIRGVGLSVARNGPDFYLMAMEELQLYASTTYKNGNDVC